MCTGIASAFNFASFSASMRADMPSFPGTTIAHLIANSCHRPDSYSTLSCLNHKALHNVCILIGLHQPYEKIMCIHKTKALLRKYSCGSCTAIDGPGPSRKYTGCPNIFHALGLMNLSKMDPLMLPQALSTVMANDVYKLSIINASGRVSFPTFY